MNFEDDIIEFLLPNSNCIHHLEKYSCLWFELNQLGTIIVLQPWLTLILYYKVEVHFRMIEFLWNCLWKFTIFIDIFEQMEQLENICWQPAEQNKILMQFIDFLIDNWWFTNICFWIPLPKRFITFMIIFWLLALCLATLFLGIGFILP